MRQTYYLFHGLRWALTLTRECRWPDPSVTTHYWFKGGGAEVIPFLWLRLIVSEDESPLPWKRGHFTNALTGQWITDLLFGRD